VLIYYTNNMEFKIIISKSANKFFFISNLTEWHFSCRKMYNPIWLKHTGGNLSLQEKKYLKIFKNILIKYGFKKYLGEYFINQLHPNKQWALLKNNITKKEYTDIKKIFNIFNKRFEKLWFNNYKILINNKKILNKEFKKTRINKIIKNLEKIFDIKINKQQTLEVFLLGQLDQNSNAGGANLKRNAVTIECAKMISETSYTERIIRTSLHELAHICFNTNPELKKSIISLLNSEKINNKKICKENIGLVSLTEELIICLLLPNGYLAEKYFHFDVKKHFSNHLNNKKIFRKNKNDLGNKSAYYLYSIIKNYINNKKSIDNKFIKKVLEIIKG